jgi:amino acid transporter
MSQTASALIGIAVLVSAVQWSWVHVVGHVDQHLMTARCQRRVQWVRAHSAQVHGSAAAVGLAALLLVLVDALR